MNDGMKSFGEMNFGHAQLGDKRRTAALVRIADLMVRRPGGTMPQKLQAPKDLKAAYRLFDCDEVTHQAILGSHQEDIHTKLAETTDPTLVIHDATELDYSEHHSLAEIGQIGNGNNRGYIAHNSLVVDPETRGAVGLCSQILHRRARVRKNESAAARRSRKNRESLLWLKGTSQLPSSWNIIDVCDQGADTFEFLEHECHSGRRFVIRSPYSRSIIPGHSDNIQDKTLLREHVRTLEAWGHWTLEVSSKSEMKSPKKKGKKKAVKRTGRTARMSLVSTPVRICSPQQKSGLHGNQPLAIWVVRVWEEDPPEGQERLEWFLLTNHPVTTFEDAWKVVSWYECRWVVEEYHKGLKTGCRIESLQFTSEDRLQPAIALISIVTLTLLSLRDAGRRPDADSRKANKIIDEDYIEVLSLWRHGRSRMDWTIQEFVLALARLGGHQNRKNDHPPGWQILWRGWIELQSMMCGAETIKQKSRRCG